ncbi:hypothetical protein Tco_1301097 [Tanacetum coccineum]
MSCLPPAHFDSEIISQTVRFRAPRDNEFEPDVAPSEPGGYDDFTLPSPTQVCSHRRTPLCHGSAYLQIIVLGHVSSEIAEAAALFPSLFRKRYRSSYEMPSPSSSPTLPIRIGIGVHQSL